MEEQERKQKLKAGKEKLAKFQKKKKAKRRSREEQSDDHADIQNIGVSGGASPIQLEGDLQSLSSVSEEEISATEEEETDSKPLVQVRFQLRAKTERVAELEENLVGKQLALDKVIKENEKLRQEIEVSKKVENILDSQSSSAMSSSKVSDSQSAEMLGNQSSEPGVNQSVENQAEAGVQLYTVADVQELIQHVQWLQLQLKQAGTTLQAQNERQAATTETLQQARTEILALQENMVTKDAIVTQLADKLTTISAEYGNLKATLAAKEDNNMPNGHGENEEDSSQSNGSADENSEHSYISQIDELTREVRVFREKADLEKEDLMKALAIVKENNEITLKENQSLKLVNERTNYELQSVSIEKDSIEQKFESAKLKLEEILVEFEKIRSEKNSVDQEKLKLSEQNLSLINELEQFEVINSNMAVEMEALKNEKIVKEENFKQMSHELDKVREINQDLETRNSSMVLEVHELKEEKDDTNKELKQLYDEVAIMKDMKKNYESIMSELKDQLDSLKQENESFQRNYESLGAEVEILNSQCQTLVTQISDYQSQIEDYENKISEATEAVEENHSLRTQNDDLYNKINNQKDIIAALKAEIEGALCKNLQLVEQLQDSVSSEELSRHDIVVLQKEKACLKEELKNMQESLTETQEENKKYKETINVLCSEVETLKQELDSSSIECETYKCKLDEITTVKSNLEEEVTEEYFTKENVFRSEAVNQKSQTPVQDSFIEQTTDSTLISVEETFLTATDLSIPAASASENDLGTNVLDDDSNLNNNADTKTDDSKIIAELQKENDMLKKELLKLQAGSIVRNAIESTQRQTSVHSEYEHLNPTEASGKAREHKEARRDSVCSPCTVLSESCYDDTAYQSFDTDRLESIVDGAQNIDTVRERLSKLQENYDRVKCSLDDKTLECELLKTELVQRGEATTKLDSANDITDDLDTHRHDSLLTSESSGTHFIDNLKVSGGIHRIDASGLEVNLHASPTLPSTLGFSSVINPSVGTVDEHVPFQDDDGASDQTAQHSEDTEVRHFQEEIDILKRTIVSQKQEKSELLAILEKERKKLNFAISEREEFEDLVQKYAKDLDNQIIVNKNLKETSEKLENEIQDLNHHNEKLDWYKNELELKLSSMEKEMLDMKVERSSQELKEEQIRDELNMLKDRLEYLESSELDIFEMREVVDSIQVEKENILKENEKLQNLLSSKEQESESNLKDIELLSQENYELLKQIKLSGKDNMTLTSNLEAVTSDLGKLQNNVEDLKQQNNHLNGEIEGLVEENSTLKTKIHTFEAEIQSLTTENEKLQSYFPNIDFQEEQLQSMDEKCKNLEKQLEEGTESNEKMVVEITDLEKKLIIVSDENEILLNKCDEMVTIIAGMDNEKTDMLGKIEAMAVKLNENSKETNVILQKKESEIEALVEENSTLKTQVNNMKEDLKEITEQKDCSAKNQVSKQQVKHIEKKNEELEKKNAGLENEIAEYQEKVNTLEYDVLELIEKIQLYDDTISEKADLATRLEHEINALLEENSTLKTKNNILEHDLNQATENKDTMKVELVDSDIKVNAAESLTFSEELSAKLELESKCKTKLQRDLEVLQTQVNQYETKTRALEDERDLLRRELTLHKNNWLEKEKYCQSLEAEKENMVKERDALKDKITDIKNNQKGTLKQLETLTAELQTCHLHLQAVSDNRNHVRSQIEILASEMETLSASKDDTESRFSRLENEFTKLKSETEMAEALVKTLEKENGILKTENEKYSKFMDGVQERIGKLDKILDKNEELASRNEALSKKIDEMESQVEKVKIEKVELEKMMDEITNLLHDMQTKYEEVKSEMETTKKKYDKEIKQLQIQLQTMNDDVQELRNMLDIMENEVYDANEEKQILKENLQQRENQYEEVVETKQKLEEMLSEKHQKDVQNKRTVCEQMTIRTNDRENTSARPLNMESLCERCQNKLKRSCVSTFTQTDFLLTEIYADSRIGSSNLDICDSISNQNNNVASALHEPGLSNLDSDKDEDTQDFTVLREISVNGRTDTHRIGNEIQTVVTSDYECQFDIQKRPDTSRCVQSEIETNSYIPSESTENFETEETEQQIMQKIDNDGTLGDTEIQELVLSSMFAKMSNIPVQKIASEMLENEQIGAIIENNADEAMGNSLLRDQMSVESSTNVNEILEMMDTGIQTDMLEPKDSICEHCIETPSDTSHHADISVLSVDSGVFSAVTGPKFSFDSPNIQHKENDRQLNMHGSPQQDKLSHHMYCFATTQTDGPYKIECFDISCQTDDNEAEELEKELQEKYEAKSSELETKIEDRLKKHLEFREQKIKLQEEHYEEKVKQIEYEAEEKYEQTFRMREAEIMINAELDKKLFEKDVEDRVNRKIELIRMEKDQQFVETMQKVRSDMKRRHKGEIARLKQELRDASEGVGPGGDGGIEEGNLDQNIVQKLNEENKDLATARDALLRRADSYSLQLQALHLDLQNIMGDEPAVETRQSAAHSLPSWLDWEISPELSFGSLNSSVDETSLSGSLDPNAFCNKSDCVAVRMRYEQLIERIKKFLSIKRVDSSASVSNASTPRADISDRERSETGQENKTPDISSETDRFVENTDPEIPVLQRITSIHLEHSMRVPCSASENIANDRHDQFVVEDVKDSKEADEINENILKQPVKESESINGFKEPRDIKTAVKKKFSSSQSRSHDIEGHFSENESDSENEVFSEGSVTIDYDQFESFNSESGKGVTDKNVHPFDECKYAKSVIRRHMSDNELGDDDEPIFRNRCLSDSRITTDRMSEYSVIQKKDKNGTESEGLFVQECKITSNEAGTLGLSGVSGFETVTNEVFNETNRSSIIEILPLERVETFEFPNKGMLRVEQDKFIKEMSSMEENPPGSTSSLVLDDSNNEKATGEDRGDFFEEVPLVRKKSGRPLMDLTFSFQSYSHNNEELKEISEPKIISVKKVENTLPPDFDNNAEEVNEQRGNYQSRDALSEELKHLAAVEGQSLFVNEEKHDSGDILENIAMDPPPVSEERQSYENTIFDVLNSICPGTNPIRVNKEDTVTPVIENFENTAHDFSESQKDYDIQELCSQIQSLEMALSAMKIENENLNEQIRETEMLQQALTEQTEEIQNLQCQNNENQTELEKVTFLKESLNLQIKKLRKENESLLQVNASTQDEIQLMKTNNDLLHSELKKVETVEKENVELTATISEVEVEKEKIENSMSDLKVEFDKQKENILQLSQEKDKVTEHKNELQLQLEMQRKEHESNITTKKNAQETLEQKIISVSNEVADLEKEKEELEGQINRMKENSVESELKMQELKDQLLSLDQEKNALIAELKCTRNECEQDKEQLNHKIKALKEENIKNYEELERSTLLKERLELEIKELQNEAESAVQVNLSSEKQIEVMKMENEQLQLKQEKLDKEKQKLMDIISEFQMQKQELEKSVTGLKSKLEAQENNMALISNEKDKVSFAKNELEINYEVQRKEWEKRDSDINAAIADLEEKLILGSNHVGDLEREKKELESQIKKMKETAGNSEKKLMEMNSNFESLQQRNEVLINKLELQESTSKQDKEQLNEKIKTLEAVNISLHEKVYDLKCQIDQINGDTESLISQFNQKLNENKELHTKVQSLKSVVNKLHETISENDNANKCLTERTTVLEAENISLKECYKQAEAEKVLASEELKSHSELIEEQQNKLDQLKNLLCEKEIELDRYKEKPDDLTRQAAVNDESLTFNKADMLEKCTETGLDSRQDETFNSASFNLQATNLLNSSHNSLKDELRKSKEINEENEWAINELASQVEQLEKEKEHLNSIVECLTQENKQLNEPLSQTEENSDKLDVESQTETDEICREISSDQIHKSVVEGLNMAPKKVCEANLLTVNEWQAKYEASEQENKSLSLKVQSLEKEKLDLNVLITYNRETYEEEKTELLEMYNDLKTEVDTLIESKKCLEDELHTLKELLESGIDMNECDKSRELTIEDLEEMEELKNSIEFLKSDMREKDNYVRKLEEHLLNLDTGLPNLASTPRPRVSSGEPVISKALFHRKLSFHDFGRKDYSIGRSNETKHEQKEGRLVDRQSESVNLDDSNNSTISESKFLAELDQDSKDPFRSSVHSDVESMSSIRDSFSSSDRIRSGLSADEDGHYALELKQYELVDEITKLRKDFHETKTIYEQETVLLSEALEREKAVTESMKIRQSHVVDEKGDKGMENTFSADLVRARQDIALLRRENNMLRIENEKWLNRIREQEQIVLDLRERLARNTSGIEEIEEVFGRQLALLQKQREELLDQIKERDQENRKLSVTLGEKAIIEDSLRREKEILSAKLQEKTDFEKELHEKQIALEKQKMLQKQFEEVVYQKDLNERNLMKQKRLLEEELLEIESKFRDREEKLGYEKNKLLDELREKHKKQKSDMAESQDDVRSVCSDSSVSDQQISRLELMLEEVEKQHKRAVEVLRDQLQSKYDRREKAQRDEYVGSLRDLHMEQQKQVK